MLLEFVITNGVFKYIRKYQIIFVAISLIFHNVFVIYVHVPPPLISIKTHVDKLHNQMRAIRYLKGGNCKLPQVPQ